MTLSEARGLQGPVVYALSDGEIFYVGSTQDPNLRFRLWHYKKNRALHQRMVAAAERLEVIVLEDNPSDLKLAEQDHILRNSLTVLNLQESAWPLCRRCQKNRMSNKRSRFCGPCWRELRCSGLS
jgi:hypothetical protein